MVAIAPRVLQVVAVVGSGGEFGGPSAVALGQVVELARRGRDVTLISLRIGDVVPPAGLPAQVWRTYPARRFVPGWGMLGLCNLRLLAALWRGVGVVDVVHVHAGRDLVSLAALCVARVRRVPFVAQTHGMVSERTALATRVFDLLFLRLLRRARAVLFLTPAEEASLRRQLGARARLTALSNGVELLPAHREHSTTRRLSVVFAARLHPVKGVLTFAAAAEILLEAGCEADFVVYGPDQGELAQLTDFIAEARLGDRLTYGGALDHEAIVGVLSGADVYVLPSSADWMPMSLLEAMSAGVATVSTSACGLATTILANQAGIVVEGSPQDVAEAVSRLLADDELRSAVGERGRSMVRDQFSVSHVVDELETIYSVP